MKVFQEARYPAAETRGPKAVTAFTYPRATDQCNHVVRVLFPMCAEFRPRFCCLMILAQSHTTRKVGDVLKTGIRRRRTVIAETRQITVESLSGRADTAARTH